MTQPRKTFTYDGIKRHLAGHTVAFTGRVSVGADYKMEVKFLTGPGIYGEPIWVSENEIKVGE